MKLHDLLYGKNVVILIDDLERYEFFKKIITSSSIKNITFLHAALYSYLYAKQDVSLNYECDNILLKGEASLEISPLSIDEVKLGKRICNDLQADTKKALETVFSNYDHLLVFKGFQFAFRHVEAFIEKDKSLFFEIGNFPNKFQWSKTGVNADSDHALRVSEVTEVIKEEDKEALKTLLFTYTPPHVAKKIRSKALEAIVNKFGHYVFKTIHPEPSILSSLKIAVSAFIAKRLIKKIARESRPVITEKYCLFISQVEFDSQTVFQASEVNLSALKKAQKIANERNIKLIVRLHPAEKNLRHLKDTIRYCQLHDIEIHNAGSLLNIVNDSEFVMTINSTGGAHSILFNKEVVNFGRAFYSGWSPSDVVKYYRYVLEEA
ncbi:hypothetical protein ACIGBN_16935 [Marinomonas sp. NPDC078689]|uniref:capsular polysaccharide export protein, LipB/KpsS family n=1 Tax=Marinomonas sp. NPDC078689 TaxID=3364147 RepID=UPI0037CC67AD